nr:ABC transporter permease subunit [Cohnella sp. CFH 77786]
MRNSERRRRRYNVHSFYASFAGELEKTWARRRTKGFLLLTVLLPAVSALLLGYAQDRSAVIAGLGSNLPLILLNLYTFAVLPLFMMMTAADSFAGETAARTMKLLLVRPVTRAKVFASKALAVAAFVAALLAALWVVSTLAQGLAAGFGGASETLDDLKAYAAAWVPMMAIGSIAIFMAQWFRQSSGAMALIILLYAAAKLLPLAFPQLSVWSVFSYTDWHLLWIGSGAPAGKLANTFVLLAAYCIMAYTAGWILFERKEH